ncbi:TetR/AcrR family transcriptional regulator [Novosphingobium piscinae]|uniref:TetR/AcrR family transcriptional regulator n=1 Tax=Novosphingobium piscinae TaxID=1507448 RepID=A0A7X1KNI3_9SPHN|nr:TetR/AcrR family transcriptional regulator [Novosphingobium piscinae]MBC2667736.1 TetR/AcrR family transcriptional regulator [Novosphingobium piscinae]
MADTAAAAEGHDDRGDAIVETAEQLLEEVGLEGLTIRAVLARTGLARRAFYDRFHGKDDLVLAVFERTLREAAAQFKAQGAGLASPLARLRLIVCGIVIGDAVRDRPQVGEAGQTGTGRRAAALSREHLRLAETRPQELQRAIEPLVRLIECELASGMAAGEVRAGDARQLAVLVYNLVSTTVHAELLGRGDAPASGAHRERLAAEVWEFTRRAIAG